ncbi:MAG: hypothetical protein KGZ82_05475 [Bacteroidales bacterium]|nr:hypothetical protein [Bacteroidales bacterium]
MKQSNNWFFQLVFVAFLMVTSTKLMHAQGLEEPVKFFGFEPGTDYKLFDYSQLTDYLKLLDTQSDRCRLIEIGRTAMDKPMYMLAISSAENIKKLDRLKAISRKLTFEVGIDQKEKSALVDEGRVFVLATMSMHANEVGPAQSVPLIAYDLATTKDAAKLSWLNEAVLLIVPSHNPDGMDMVVSHYRNYLGTTNEKTSMPGLYHKYVGHDNNRDFNTLTQPETKAINRLFSSEWLPQVMVEKHQMSATGVRYFVSPPHDPIAENVDPGVWNWMSLIGNRVVQRMTNDSMAGVSRNYLFDDYWPGNTETCIWKNTIGMLTEAASVQHASPVYIEAQEITTGGKGLAENKISINMPMPWTGGWWRLSDIVHYEISAMYGILEASAAYRKEILNFRNELAEKMVQQGKSAAPYYYILPQQQHDISELNGLVALLLEHGVRVYRLTEDLSTGKQQLYAGDIVVPLAQPFRAFIKEVMEKQDFPLRHYTPGGEMVPPYDITSWSLPLHFGLECLAINESNPFMPDLLHEITQATVAKLPLQPNQWALAFEATNNESYRVVFKALQAGAEVFRTRETLFVQGTALPAGSYLVRTGTNSRGVFDQLSVDPLVLTEAPEAELEKLILPSIGLVETWFHDMDAGWTRFIFDTYGIPYQLIRPETLAQGIPSGLKVLVFPSASKSALLDGNFASGNEQYFFNYPEAYTKGMGKDGLAKVMRWVSEGGSVISWEASTALFEGVVSAETSVKDKNETFRLPFKDVSTDLTNAGLYVPGTLLRLKLNTKHPLTAGMPEQIGVFSRGTPVFATSLPLFDMDRRIIAAYAHENIVASGFAKQADLLQDKAAVVWVQKGKGKLLLMAFNPQFRASTHGSFKLLFNALLHENWVVLE